MGLNFFGPSKSRRKRKPALTNGFAFVYGFQVADISNEIMRVIITKNDIPYCQYDSTGEFFDPSHSKLMDMTVDEKAMLWKFINAFEKDVGKFSLFSD